MSAKIIGFVEVDKIDKVEYCTKCYENEVLDGKYCSTCEEQIIREKRGAWNMIKQEVDGR